MSYDTILKFKINRKDNSITYTSRDSNSWGWNGKRTVSTFTNRYKTLDDFKNGVFDFADGALDGTCRFSSSSTMMKRLAYLQQNNLLQLVDKDFNWYNVKRNDETFAILSGAKRVKPKAWIIANGANTIGYKKTMKYSKLVQSRFTKFYSLDSVKKAFNHLQRLDWVNAYNLSIKQLQN